MSTYVPRSLRRFVEKRANGVCEYCLAHQDDTYAGGTIEHIVSRKHKGATHSSNLAWSCLVCNGFKGSDIATVYGGELTRLFNPRKDHWGDHFKLHGSRILGLSDIGRATVELLRFNAPERILERDALRSLGKFPPRTIMRLLKRSRP